MDRVRFDALVRGWATATTRRQALAGLLGAGLAGLLGVAEAKQHSRKRGKANRRGRAKGKDRSKTRAEATTCCSSGTCTPGPGKNLTQCCYQDNSLAGQNFKGANLSGANFSGADLSGANFNAANVSKACFVDADLTGAIFSGANTSGAIYCRTQTDSGLNTSGCGKGTACCPTCNIDLGGECAGAGDVCCGGATCQGGTCACPTGSIRRDDRCLRCDVCPRGCRFTSIAAAVAGTPAGGTIVLCPGTYPTVNVTIAKDLTIVGAGAGDDPLSASILDAGQQGRVFVISADVTVTLSLLTIANGVVVSRGAQGGCIHNAGDLTIDRAAITRCVLLSPDISFGGGIFNQAGGVVTVNRTTIADCSADNGGAIHNAGAATLDDVAVKDGFTGIFNAGTLTLKGATRVADNRGSSRGVGFGVFNSRGTVACQGQPRVCGNPDDATATAETNCFDVTDPSCAGVCLGNATPGSGACLA